MAIGTKTLTIMTLCKVTFLGIMTVRIVSLIGTSSCTYLIVMLSVVILGVCMLSVGMLM
jgi:hypothetical protein